MSAVTTLICDDCGRIIAVAATAEAARAEVARREAHGVSHVVVPASAADALRPVVARLAGH